MFTHCSATNAYQVLLHVFVCCFLLQTGEICLDILKNAWSPAWTLQSVCRAIIALMAHPEPDSPLNCDSGKLACILWIWALTLNI